MKYNGPRGGVRLLRLPEAALGMMSRRRCVMAKMIFNARSEYFGWAEVCSATRAGRGLA